jgi:hypothetical protein
MKIRINFFAKPSEPNVKPSLIACPTGDFASLEGSSDCLGGWQQTRDHGAFDYYRVFG